MTSPRQVPGRHPKRHSYQHPSATPPITFPGGNSVPPFPIDQSYSSPHEGSPHRPRGQFTRSHSEITLSPAHLMPPPPVPSSQFQTPQSMYFSSPSSVDSNPNYFSTYTQAYPSPFYDTSYSAPSMDWNTDDAMSYMEFDPRLSDMESDMMSQSVAMSEMDTKTDYSVSMASTSPSKASTKTPRPPNAWILYRSDKLKAIAAGEIIPGLDAVVAELQTGSSASPSNESGEGEDKKTRQRPPKKGAKPPTEGLLSLGRGKLGRGIPQADISKMISMLWKRESPAVRDRYESLALMKKREHQAKYPDYKFQPQRKADKVRAREEKERAREAMKREKEAQKGGRTKKTRSKANRYSPTATSSRTSTSTSYQAPSLESGGESGWQSGTGALITPNNELPLPRLNPFPMPSVSLPSMNPEDHPAPNPFDLLMEQVEEPKFFAVPLDNMSMGSSPERPSTAPEYLSSMVPEMVFPQPVYPLPPPPPPVEPPTHAPPPVQTPPPTQRMEPVPGQPLQRQQQQQQQWIYAEGGAQPDTPSIIDVGSEMQMQLQPGMTDYAVDLSSVSASITSGENSVPPKPKTNGKKAPKKKKPKASQLAATWGSIIPDEAESTEPEVIEIVDLDAEDDNMEVSAETEVAQDEAEAIEKVHTEMEPEPDRKGKKKETRPSRALGRPTKALTTTEPLVRPTINEPEYFSSDLYHIHAGPYTVETCVPNGQTLNAGTVGPVETTETAEPEEDIEYEGFTIPPGTTIGEWYDMHKKQNEVLVATRVNEAPSQPGPTTEINAHFEEQNGQQVLVPDEWDPAQLTMLQALIEQVTDQGPTISGVGAPLLSPIDATWTLSPTQTSFGDNIGNDPSVTGARRVTSFSVTKRDGTVLPFNVVPRHISGHISPAVDGHFTRDRLLSFGDAGMIFGQVGSLDSVPEMDITEDDFFSSFVMAHEEALVSETSASTSAPASVGGLEALTEEVEVVDGDGDEMEQDAPVPTSTSTPSSASSNKTMRVTGAREAEQRTPTTRSMRGGIRGRAVGRKFNEAT